MHFFKSAFMAAAFTVAGWVSPASAAPILQGTSTSLTGINNLDVDGQLYNMTFVAGTCASVFGTCDQAHFTFITSAGANDAAHAIIAAIAGTYFDTHLGTVGCSRIDRCLVLTPYEVFFPPGFDPILRVSYAVNPYASPNSTLVGGLGVDYDTSTDSQAVFAVYTPVSVAAVPEPLTLSLFGAGLGGAFAMRRRREAQKA